MGGKGSGSFPDDGSTHRGGRSKKAAVAVTGSGLPVQPKSLSERALAFWDVLTERLAGIVFEQDSYVLGRMAVWMDKLESLDEQAAEMYDAIEDCEDIKVSLGLRESLDALERRMLAIERNLDTKCAKFGMTPRDRQLLLVPKEEEELDEFEKLMKARG